MNTELEDIFKEELSKKENKEKKKLEKFKKQEEKKKQKKEKQLEKKENKEFQKRKKQVLEEPVDLKPIATPTSRVERKELEETRELIQELAVLRKNSEVEKKPNFIGEILLGLSLVLLFFLSLDYAFYCYFKKEELLIQAILLCGTTIPFILAMIIKKESVKKVFTVLTSLCFIGLILYQILSV